MNSSIYETEFNNLIYLIKNNINNKNNNWNLFDNCIMNDYDNLSSKIIQHLGNNSRIYQKNIDIYNKQVFSIFYNNNYYIIIPDNENYGPNYDKKLFIVIIYSSITHYNKAINDYYSNFN